MELKRLLVIGGSDAGISAALRAKEIDPGTDATVIVAWPPERGYMSWRRGERIS